MHSHEFALVLIKPDATEHGLEAEILYGLEGKGLQVAKYGTIQFDTQLVLEFYEWEKLDHPDEINGYICVTPLPVWIVTGYGAIAKTMELKTFLRKKYCDGLLKNLFHCPVSQEESRRQFELIKERCKQMKQRTRNQVEAIVFKTLASGEYSFLMLKRAPQRGGFWQPVTGNVEKDETFETAALREVREELGITDIIQLIDTEYSYEFTDNDLDQFERIFGVEISPDQEIKLSSEHTEYRWVAKDEAVNSYLKYPGNKEGLRRLYQKLTRKKGG